jgi:alpha-galactosidase/6-phospho-beta-glucosidase family protein
MASLPFRVRDSHAGPPALVNARGTDGIVIGELPEPIAGRRNLQISICNLAAEAGVAGSREKVLQALLADLPTSRRPSGQCATRVCSAEPARRLG